MIKHLLSVLGQFLLFLIVFAVFSFIPVLHIQQVLGTTADGTRIFIWDGLILAAVLCVVIAGIEATQKRMHATAWTVVAFALAAGAGMALKLGRLTR